MTETCATCRFWQVEVGVGFCMRYPPQLVVFDAVLGVRGNQEAVEVWPETAATDWCGEWKEKPQEMPAPIGELEKGVIGMEGAFCD